MKKYTKILFVTSVLLILSNHIIGQTSFVFHHLGTRDGLSNSSVTSLLKDSYGFLWVGTGNGLNRYDGYEFKVYMVNPGVHNTLLTNNIVGLQEDGLRNIWIDFGYGYAVYNRGKDCFETDVRKFLRNLGIMSDENSKIFVDKAKNLVVLSRNNVYIYNVKDRNTICLKSRVRIDGISSVAFSRDNQFIYAMQQSGVFWKMNKRTGKQTIITIPDYIQKYTVNNYGKIFVDSKNGLWIYSYKNDQVFYKKSDGEDWNIIELKSDIQAQSNVITIKEGQNHQIWIGTDHKGLFVYNLQDGTMRNFISQPLNPTTLSANNINCIFIDNTGTVWIGHNKKGLSFYNESFHFFANIQCNKCNDISRILEMTTGEILLGTDGDGLFMKDKTGIVNKLPIPNTAITSMIEDKKGRIWIGTYQKGLFCYDHGKFSQYTTSNSSLSDNNVWSLQVDRFGSLWIGTLAGKLHKLEAGSSDFSSLKTPYDNIIRSMDMFYDGGDKIYVGTVFGLMTVDVNNNNRVYCFTNAKGTQRFRNQQITCVYKGKNNILWLGGNTGLTVWDMKKDTLYYLDVSTGLCDNIVQGILEDNLQNIWVTTSKGVSALSVDRSTNETLTIDCKNFFVKDGLKSDYFNAHSICALRDGDILVGSTDGYTVINPYKITEKRQPLARVVFTKLTVGNTEILVDSMYNKRRMLNYSIEFTSTLDLKYNDKQISLQFTTTDLINADKVKYSYKIEGFNNQWITTRTNEIIITSLPPGKYRLLISACNSDGVWSNEPKVLFINVAPPFYYSFWAITLYVLAVLSLTLYLIYRTRQRHQRKLAQQKAQMAIEQEIQLKEMKLKFFTNISHDLRTPLTLIVTPLQLLLKEVADERLNKKLGGIYKNAQQLLSLINSLLDFRKLDVGAESLHLKAGNIVDFVNDIYDSFKMYATECKISFAFDSDVESLWIYFDHDKIRKSIVNLLSNAFKYTPDHGKIDLRIYTQDSEVCISVSDTGIGISDDEKRLVFNRFYQSSNDAGKTGSGIGLHIVSEYVKLHEGTISITDNIPKGTVFTLKFPIMGAAPVENEDDSEELTEAFDAPEQKQEENQPKKFVLLFVDDNKDLCEFISDNLADDYKVLIANNGQEALSMLAYHDVNIVVSDVMMPVMDGNELCKQIKTNIKWSHIPVILLTAKTAEESRIEGLELGADDYITKPFNLDILKLRITKFIEWTQKSHQSFSQKLDVSPSEITITTLDEKLLEKALKIVEGHMSDTEFSVEILGESLGLSRGHLYKKLMAITGKGPAEFIRTIRLKRGRQLLEKSQLQIAEIAYEVGYNSPKRFTINFKEEFGMSPSEYLRIYRLQKPE